MRSRSLSHTLWTESARTLSDRGPKRGREEGGVGGYTLFLDIQPPYPPPPTPLRALMTELESYLAAAEALH